jgi:predicted helicase
MRQSLRKTFDKIYIVNLHGDMRKRESGNPFDIRVGVAIAFMVRIDNKPNKNANVFYMDVPQSTREEKFGVLSQGFQEKQFKLLTETKKNYFIDFDTTFLDRFDQFIPVDSLFKSNPMSGIMAGRDRLVYDVDEDALKKKLFLFFNKEFEELNKLKIKVHDTKTWKKSKIFEGTNLETTIKGIKTINYRGWDFRYIAYNRILLEGHRMGYIDQISQSNPALTLTKSSRKSKFETAFIVENLLEKCFMSVTDTSYAFPLYLNDKINVIKPELPYSTKAEEIFYYSYAVLNAPTYRNRYDEYLRKSFPRIPFPKNEKLFFSLAKYGEKLANIHLLRYEISFNIQIPELDSKEWIIKNYTYNPKANTLYFDTPKKKGVSLEKIPCIKGITPEMWNFSIGTINQIEQFLKSRKFTASERYNLLQRGLNHDELVYFLKIITAIEKTIEILPRIDEVYKKIDVLD